MKKIEDAVNQSRVRATIMGQTYDDGSCMAKDIMGDEYRKIWFQLVTCRNFNHNEREMASIVRSDL